MVAGRRLVTAGADRAIQPATAGDWGSTASLPGGAWEAGLYWALDYTAAQGICNKSPLGAWVSKAGRMISVVTNVESWLCMHAYLRIGHFVLWFWMVTFCWTEHITGKIYVCLLRVIWFADLDDSCTECIVHCSLSCDLDLLRSGVTRSRSTSYDRY